MSDVGTKREEVVVFELVTKMLEANNAIREARKPGCSTKQSLLIKEKCKEQDYGRECGLYLFAAQNNIKT